MRTLIRVVEDLCKMRRRIRVVVLGSAKSGKTVFLTSLASHLKHHKKNDGQFDLKGWEATWLTDFPQTDSKGLPPFPYASYLDEMRKPLPEFPEKTTVEMSVLSIPLTFKKDEGKKRLRRDVLLELMDLPGERVADLAMANKGYREWCEWMNRVFLREKSSDSYRAYLEKANGAASDVEIFDAYKEHLVRELYSYSPWITPSIVKVANGKAGVFKEMVRERPLGVDEASQFAPLPDGAFTKGHPLNRFVKEFSRGYEKYRKTVVAPIRDWLAEADQLVYLVDVLGILTRGVSAYNSEWAFGSDVIGMFRRPETRIPVLGWVWDSLCGLFRTRINAAYLVATKADLAFGMEGRSAMCKLAEDMLGKAFRGLGVRRSKVCACAAVNTVRTAPDGNGKAFARLDKGSKDESEYLQPVIPTHWARNAAEWAAYQEDCSFRSTFPLFEDRCDAVPPQTGLSDLVCSMLEGTVL